MARGQAHKQHRIATGMRESGQGDACLSAHGVSLLSASVQKSFEPAFMNKCLNEKPTAVVAAA